MSLSSYDELLKQVASLKFENCHLRKELKDNSSHLTKLENDASNMKDVLSHIQVAFNESGNREDQEDFGKETSAENYTEDDPAFASHNSLCDESFDDDLYQGQATATGLEEGETSMTESAESQMVDVFELVQKLDSERKQLLQDLERDEHHRKWFYNQLKSITQKMESLQHSESYSAQTDHARRQLDAEAHKVQGAMQEKLGSGEQSKMRQEARLERIKNIESEMGALLTQRKPAAHGVKDVATSTMLCREVFQIKPDQEEGVGGYVCDRAVHRGNHCVTLGTQTGEVIYREIPDGVAPGMPLNPNLSVIYHGAWPIEKSMSGSDSFDISLPASQDLASVISFNSTNTNSGSSTISAATAMTHSGSGASGDQAQHLGPKVEMVYSLLSMLGTHDKDDMSRTLFAMSQSQDSCIAMRQSGCLPLLLQLLHGSDKDSGLLGKTRGSKAARARAAAALHNIVHCHHDDKRGRREARTLRLLEQIRAHCDQQRGDSEEEEEESVVNSCSEMDHHPGAAIAALMKLSFDEDYRHAICTLGGLQAIAELLEIDNRTSGPANDYSTTVRRYACMALTNLTFGDGKNKALLCSMRGSMEALVDQLKSSNEDLIQAAASVLRNLSWRADLASKKTLREIGGVTILMKAAMTVKKETTLKSILSALWNLSSHCSENKAEICAVEGALQFLVGLLTYKSAAKTLAIVENGGGILRNVSSQIAIREDYRQVLRQSGCLQILLHHLRSTSLTIVSNACGTLWNLSARCEEDQNTLREMGAVSMLRNLVHSRHKMISSGSSAALRNLVSSIPAGKSMEGDKSVGSSRPSLHVRKQRALEAELDQSLSETCENVESPRNSPTEINHRSESEPRRFLYNVNQNASTSVENGLRQEDDGRKHLTRRQMMPRNCSENVVANRVLSPQRVARAGSQDSVGSTHSDISHDRTRAHTMLAKSSHLLHKRQGGSLERKDPSAPPNAQHMNNSQLMSVSEHKPSNLGNGVTMVNNTPAHVRRPQPGTTYHPPQHNQPSWHSLPNSRIVQYMHEVAMYAGVEPSANVHSQVSLTQSAPSQSLLYPNQQSLLERLAKSSSGFTSTLNSIAASPNLLSNSLDFDSRMARPSSEDDTDQPVNYSLKYQDERSGAGNKSSSSGNVHSGYGHLTAVNSTPNFRAVGIGDHLRASGSGLSISMDHNFLLNNSQLDKKSVNSATKGGSIIQDPAIHTPHRAVPNLVHNRFHTPQPHRSTDPGYHPTQFIAPQVHPFPSSHPANYHFLSSSHHLIQPPHSSSLPLNPATACHPGFPPQGKVFNSPAQFNTMPAAHQNKAHQLPIKQFSAYAETDLDSVIDQPTDFSLRYNEVSEDNCSDGYQEQPINYSMRFRDNGVSPAAAEIPGYQDERHCVECKYAEARRANERLDNSSNDDQVRTFYTEGTPYLSTATSLTDLTQAGKTDAERGEEDDDDNGDINNASSQDNYGDTSGSRNVADGDRTLTLADVEMKCKAEVNHAPSSSGSQTTDRRTGSTVICGHNSITGGSLVSKTSSQMSDMPADQLNFHADTNEGALDQTKTYNEEGTPVCFSRVSSLSSLHSSEARDGDVPPTRLLEKPELANIEEAETPDAMIISVIENKHVSGGQGEPGSNLRQVSSDQVPRQSYREVKTVTFDENHQVEETPLMFSRSSSPESLSSFDTQSVHSSVVSEYSRRASEVVSPSDIPDSPSESMPSSPRRTHSPTRRLKEFSSTPKSLISAKQLLDFNQTPSTLKSEAFMSFATFDEEDKPINFAMRNAEIQHLHAFPDFDDDKPIDFSSFHREQEAPPITFSTFQKNIQPPSNIQNGHFGNGGVTPRAKILPTLVEQAGESEMPLGKPEVPSVYAAKPPSGSCLPVKRATGTPSTCVEPPSSGNSSTRASASKNLNPVLNRVAKMAPPSRASPKKELPVPPKTFATAPEAKITSPAPPVSAATPHVATAPAPLLTDIPTFRGAAQHLDQYVDTSEDCVKSYATEGTPLNFSAATSMTDLSVLTQNSSPSPKKSVPSTSAKSEVEEVKSDSGSLCEENEELLLTQMIESGMPKSKPGRKFRGRGPADSGAGSAPVKQSSRDCNTSAFIPRTSNLTVMAPFHDFIPTDTMKTYNVEGTPKNFSAATSLSDLTIDSGEGVGSSTGRSVHKQNPASGKGTACKIPKLSAPQSIPKYQPKASSVSQSNDPSSYSITFSPPCNDTLHVYKDEGTPITFSRNDSLSSLGGDEDRGAGSGVSASPHKDKQRSNDRDESDSSSSIPRERHVVGQSSEDSSVAGDKVDRPIKFEVEDTPVCFSRNSSLSSITSLDKLDQVESPVVIKQDKVPSAGSSSKPEMKHSKSNDSLSDELADCDPTPSEQALLEQCINSAMPKSRLPRGEDRARRHSKAKFLTQKTGSGKKMSSSANGAGGGLMKSASLEMTNGIVTGYLSGSENETESQGSLSHEQSSCENLMTRSCSDTTELDFEFQMTPSSRQTGRRRQRHRSQDDDDSQVRGGSRHRSLSQDSENYLKVQKDISNKLAQAGSRGQVHLGSLGSLEDVLDKKHCSVMQSERFANSAKVLDSAPASRAHFRNPKEKSDPEKTLSDFAAKVREISNDNMGGLLALRDDVDIDSAVFTGHSIVELTTGDPENRAKSEEDCQSPTANTTMMSSGYDDSDEAADTTIRAGRADRELDGEDPPDVHFFIEDDNEDPDYDEVYDQADESFEGEISPEEEERLLAENINLVMSEIQTTEMSGSTVDEDLFIENETISLVSNDYASDTNSEVSATWSVTSDKTSDLSSATLAEVKSQGSSSKPGQGPKILKPGASARPTQKAAADEGDETKAVRGRRKPLYPGKSANRAKVAPSSVNAGMKGAPGQATISKPNAGTPGLKKTPPKNPTVAQISPRSKQTATTPVNNTQRNGGAQKKNTSPRSRSAGPASTGKTISPPAGSQKLTPKGQPAQPAGRAGPVQGKQSVGKTSSSPPSIPSASKPANKNLKPNTPAKPAGRDGSAANTKRPTSGSSSNLYVKNSSPDNKENKEQVVMMREKKGSAVPANHRLSNSSGHSSSETGNRLSNGSIPESWSKALDSYNFVVDAAQDGMAYKQIQMQRNSKDAPATVKRVLRAPNKSTTGNSPPSAAPAAPSLKSNTSSIPTLGQSKLPVASPSKASLSVSPNNVQKNNGNKSNNMAATRSSSNNTISSLSGGEKKLGQTVAKNASSPANVGSTKVFNRSLSNDAKASTTNRSNDSLKTPNRPLTPVSSGNSRRSSNSSGSGIPTRKSEGSSSSLNIEPSKRTPPGGVGKKQITSKIATLWKRDGSLERSPSRESPLSSASSSLSKLPISTVKTSPGSAKPSSLPPSGFKTKAATLPASASLTASKSAADGICKSATYEKLSSDVKVQDGRHAGRPMKKPAEVCKAAKQKESSYESPETGVRRGEVFELCDDDEDDDDEDYSRGDRGVGSNMMYDTNDSLENKSFDESPPNRHGSGKFTRQSTSDSVDSLDQSYDSSPHIDTSTFRKKKRDPSISDFELPNADETCKSMCSFNDSLGSPHANSSVLHPRARSNVNEDSILSEMNISVISNNDSQSSKHEKKGKHGEEKTGGKTKSKVAQGLKRLFGSGRHNKDKDKESKSKSSEKEQGKGKKNNGKDKKNSKDRKEYDFFSANIKIEPSTMSNYEDKLVCHQGTSTLATTPKPSQLRAEHKVSPSAIVAPFNYNPPATTPTGGGGSSSQFVVDLLSGVTAVGSITSASSMNSEDHSESHDSVSLGSNPEKHMTKTEMLLARRRQKNVSTSKSEEGRGEGDITAACMVTTV